jgi:pantoate kinase
VHYDKSREDLLRAGATGGGYILSTGAISKVTVLGNSGAERIDTIVNGDRDYEARTTREALSILMKATGKMARLRVEQQVDVPIGFGFGASAASALSAVLAASAALDLELAKEEVAQFAHRAEIIQQTGLGTVSAAYDGAGAGFVYEPGAPGIAKFKEVENRSEVQIVAASVAPLPLGLLLSSSSRLASINRFGDESLRRVLAKPTLPVMAAEGVTFTRKVGILTPEVASLIRTAKKAGARFASQNMVGQAMHAIVPARRASAVAKALSRSRLTPRVDLLEIGKVKASVIAAADLDYPTVTSSLV